MREPTTDEFTKARNGAAATFEFKKLTAIKF
jgi:hypothetical protein